MEGGDVTSTLSARHGAILTLESGIHFFGVFLLLKHTYDYSKFGRGRTHAINSTCTCTTKFRLPSQGCILRPRSWLYIVICLCTSPLVERPPPKKACPQSSPELESSIPPGRKLVREIARDLAQKY